MINPVYMCSKHISGEHGELHKFLHNFEKRHNMRKRLEEKQIFPQLMKERHDLLARFLNHKSPYVQPDISYLPDGGVVPVTPGIIMFNIIDLATRCADCRRIMLEKGLIDLRNGKVFINTGLNK